MGPHSLPVGVVKTGPGSLRRVDDTPPIPPSPTASGDDPSSGDIVITPGRTGIPSRGAVALAFLGVVVAGVLGGMIGYGLADIMCTDDCGPMLAVGTIVGAALAAAGVGVVAVLVMRAMVEWKRTPPPDEMPGNTGSTPTAATGHDGPEGHGGADA